GASRPYRGALIMDKKRGLGAGEMAPRRWNLPPGFRRYGGATLAVAVAALIRWLLQPYFGFDLPFITFFAAVFVTAWLFGFGPTLLAVVLSATAALSLFFAPVTSKEDWLVTIIGLALFVAIG